MIAGTAVLSTALTSLSVIYQAYAKVKSNKERCRQLVERCQLIVDRLQAILLSNNDSGVLRRVKNLEHTFRLTADTITKVGKQSYIASTLRSEENAALIEDSQHALIELVSILSLEQIIDVSIWQRESEAASRSDYESLLVRINDVEQEVTAAVRVELARLGATQEHFLECMRSIYEHLSEGSAGLSPPPGMPIPDLTASHGSLHRPRSMSSPTSSRPSGLQTSDLPVGGCATATPRNRMSRLRISPPSEVSVMSPWSAIEPEQEIPTRMVPIQPQATRNTDTTLPDVPVTPPPAYKAWEELPEIFTTEADQEGTHNDSVDSDASGEAVRADDSPVPSLGSLDYVDLDKPLSDSMGKVREALKRKDVTNFSILKTIGSFGKTNKGVLVEMWVLPRIKTFDRTIPLSCFVSMEKDNLQLARSRVTRTNEGHLPMLTLQQEYNHVLLLCPREVRPSAIVIKTRQSMPQQSVRAYVLDTIEALTLVSVKESDKKTQWLLIPYYPDMYVWEAKQYIQKHLGNAIVVGCRVSESSRSPELNDESTLEESCVKAYEHSLCFKISTSL
ncbi:hypothetical protein M0805_007341 [Coniferiporia weirii]|nr:hypothetical protein M0805_007341 [Coniferiporia weirii]